MIKEIYYEEIPSDVMTMKEGGAYYYHLNLAKLNQTFLDEYMDYEEKQLTIKNKILGAAIKRGDVKHIRPDKGLISLSPQKNKVVIMAEL